MRAACSRVRVAVVRVMTIALPAAIARKSINVAPAHIVDVRSQFMKSKERLQGCLGALSVIVAMGVNGCDSAPYVWLGLAAEQPTEASNGVFVSIEASHGRRVRITTMSGNHIINGSVKSVMSCELLIDEDLLQRSFIVLPDAKETIVRAEVMSDVLDDCAKGIVTASFQLAVSAEPVGVTADGGKDGSGGAGGEAASGTSGTVSGTTGTGGSGGATSGTSGAGGNGGATSGTGGT